LKHIGRFRAAAACSAHHCATLRRSAPRCLGPREPTRRLQLITVGCHLLRVCHLPRRAVPSRMHCRMCHCHLACPHRHLFATTEHPGHLPSDSHMRTSRCTGQHARPVEACLGCRAHARLWRLPHRCRSCPSAMPHRPAVPERPGSRAYLRAPPTTCPPSAAPPPPLVSHHRHVHPMFSVARRRLAASLPPLSRAQAREVPHA
jgi:hypothetical protein